MKTYNAEYEKLVLNDIRSFSSLNHPVKASLVERLLKWRAPLAKLHPNPMDEFCNPEIGPNHQIVNQYFEQIKRSLTHVSTLEIDPLIVEKMSIGGYMLLNGHHRWLAATRANVKTVPIKIVNVTTEEEIIKAVNSSNNDYCLSIDLDEVLINDDENDYLSEAVFFPLNLIYPQKIRKNAAAMIAELQKQGFDVWVYSGQYYSTTYIKQLLFFHKIKPTGIINGMKNRKPRSGMAEAFREKYKEIVHIDNESALIVNPKSKEFNTVEVSSGKEWANEIVKKIQESVSNEG
ncbi:MAG: ParB N-terminal domain-containing protein [Butyrivibrio sp.]|nr:ParB N-terminal domain-containing protein [Butyrivibrio sp.]